MFFATFILSTGRCGTQWLAENFSRYYGDRIWVTHEPLHDAYQTRAMLGARKPESLDAVVAAPILAHMKSIERQLENGDYMECGHPCWSTIPYLLDRFHGRIRVIHLVRDPVDTSYSWLTHSAYQKPLLPHLREKILFSPFDAGAALHEYRERWAALSSYEKCLYYWAEVNQLALSTQATIDAPWLRMTFEDLFFGSGLELMLEFLGLAPLPGLFDARAITHDRYRYLALEQPQPVPPGSHPHIAAIARAVGYSLDAPMNSAEKNRYFASRR